MLTVAIFPHDSPHFALLKRDYFRKTRYTAFLRRKKVAINCHSYIINAEETEEKRFLLEWRIYMEQLRMSAGKKTTKRWVQILTDLMKTNKEFQIMITVPASGASSLSEMAKEEETAVKPAAAHNLERKGDGYDS